MHIAQIYGININAVVCVYPLSEILEEPQTLYTYTTHTQVVFPIHRDNRNSKIMKTFIFLLPYDLL